MRHRFDKARLHHFAHLDRSNERLTYGYHSHESEAEAIAARLHLERAPRKPKPVTLRRFSWETTDV